MISNETKNIIQEHFDDLPPVIQDVVLHSNWQAKIRSIVQKHKLHIDQGAAIENLVLITMLGIETPEGFIENAKEHARVDETQAFQISADVEREIFHEIRQKLISITESHDTIDEVERVTNELTKADDDIAQAAKKEVGKGTVVNQSISEGRSEAKPQESKQTSFTHIPQVKPKIVEVVRSVPTIVPSVKPKIVSAARATTTQSKQEPAVIRVTTSTPATKPIAVPTPTQSPKPTPVTTATSTPAKPVVPKHLDPIVAARLGAPVLSARNRLEMEMSESSISTEEKLPKAPSPVVSSASASYNKVDPYREPVA